MPILGYTEVAMPSEVSNFYKDGPRYDAVLGGQADDLAFYLARAKAAQGPVLELACGTGRLTIPLAKSGADMTGLDLSDAMLEQARKKAGSLPIDWAWADMRDFQLGRVFKLIYIPYNSLQHLHEREDIEACFASAKRHLDPEGRFIVDVFNPNIPLLARKPREIYPVEGLNPAPDGSVVTGEEVRYDDAKQVYHIKWHFSGGAEEELHLRVFFPREMEALLHHAGYKILEVLGDFKGKAFESGDFKQIYVCGLK